MRDHESESELTRAQLARRSGCNLETIRYYEGRGILPPPPRSAAGYRLYGPDHLARLRFVRRARALGFSLADIRGLLGLSENGEASCAQVKSRTEAHLADVRRKIADLQRIETVLAVTAARCTGDAVPDCPVLDALAAEDGGFAAADG